MGAAILRHGAEWKERLAEEHAPPKIDPQALAREIGIPGRTKIIHPVTRELIWQSNPGMQTDLFFWSNPAGPDFGKGPQPDWCCDEILIGGPRGPGKTNCAIIWVGWHFAEPGYMGLILRNTLEELKETIAKAWDYYKKLGAIMRGKPIEFYWPRSGATVYTGYLKDDESFEQYRGHEYQRIVVEEGQRIPRESLFAKLLSSNRSSNPRLRPQVLITANPDGPGAGFLKARYVKVVCNEDYDSPLIHQKISAGDYFPPKHPFRSVTGRMTIYIPGSLADNPQIMAADPTYVQRLNDPGLPEWQRKAWIEGDWEVSAGAFFPTFRTRLYASEAKKFPHAYHVIPSFDIPGWCHRWIGMDWGFNHHAAIYLFAIGQDRRIHVENELVLKGAGSDEIGAEIAKMCLPVLRRMKKPMIRAYLSPDAFQVRDKDHMIAEGISYGVETILGPGSSVMMEFTTEEKDVAKTDEARAIQMRARRIDEAERRINGQSIWFTRANDSRKAGWDMIRRMLRWVPLSRVVEHSDEYAQRLLQEQGVIAYREYLMQFEKQKEEILPMLRIHDCCPVLVETFPKLIQDPDNREDIIQFDSDERDIGDDPADALRYGIMGYKEFEAKVPREVYVEDEIERLSKICTDPNDINIRIRIGEAAERRWDSQNHDGEGIVIVSESMALR